MTPGSGGRDRTPIDRVWPSSQAATRPGLSRRMRMSRAKTCGLQHADMPDDDRASLMELFKTVLDANVPWPRSFWAVSVRSGIDSSILTRFSVHFYASTVLGAMSPAGDNDAGAIRLRSRSFEEVGASYQCHFCVLWRVCVLFSRVRTGGNAGLFQLVDERAAERLTGRDSLDMTVPIGIPMTSASSR